LSTDQQWDIVTGVGLTALAVAAGRAVETERPDALISDPYASRLVAAAQPPESFPISADGLDLEGMEDVEKELWTSMSGYMALRSRVFDDFFLQAAADGVTQAVILASGLDTRPYRLSWPAGTVCYELDQPAVLDFKFRTLDEGGATPACTHRAVPIDLRDDWGAALEAAGFDVERPTAWLAEGLLPYLPPDAEVRLLREMTRLSAPGSRCAIERIDDVARIIDDPQIRAMSGKMNFDFQALLPQGEREPVDAQLTGQGWELTERLVSDIAAEFDRPMPPAEMFTEHARHTFGRLVPRNG